MGRNVSRALMTVGVIIGTAGGALAQVGAGGSGMGSSGAASGATATEGGPTGVGSNGAGLNGRTNGAKTGVVGIPPKSDRINGTIDTSPGKLSENPNGAIKSTDTDLATRPPHSSQEYGSIPDQTTTGQPRSSDPLRR
jgi:hypothetical protein